MIKTKLKKILGDWSVNMSDGTQGFTLYPCENKKDAIWRKEMLDKFIKRNLK